MLTRCPLCKTPISACLSKVCLEWQCISCIENFHIESNNNLYFNIIHEKDELSNYTLDMIIKDIRIIQAPNYQYVYSRNRNYIYVYDMLPQIPKIVIDIEKPINTVGLYNKILTYITFS